MEDFEQAKAYSNSSQILIPKETAITVPEGLKYFSKGEIRSTNAELYKDIMAMDCSHIEEDLNDNISTLNPPCDLVYSDEIMIDYTDYDFH